MTSPSEPIGATALVAAAEAAAATAVAAGAARGAVGLVAINLTAARADDRVAEAERCAEAAEQAARRATAAL